MSVASALLGFARWIGVKAAATGSSGAPDASLKATVGDLGKGVSGLATLFAALSGRATSWATIDDAANEVQTVLVDLGLEPPQLAAAITALEWVAPIAAAFLKSNAQQPGGAIPPSYPPGGGPGAYRGR